MTTVRSLPRAAPAIRAPGRPLRVLYLEDAETDSAFVRRYLMRQGYDLQIVCVDEREGFVAALTPELDVILSDHSLPGFGSVEALRLARACCPEVPFIIVSGTISEEGAVEAIKNGASDYIWKDRLQRLEPAIENARRERRLLAEHEAAMEAGRRSEALNRAVLAALPQYIAVLDPEGVIVQTNEAWQRAAETRGTRVQFGNDVGTSYLDVCRRAADRGDALALGACDGIAAVLAGDADHFAMEYPYEGPSAREWYLMTVTPLEGRAGAVISHQSVTELRHSQGELLLSQRRLKALFDGSLDAILLADDAGRYVDANPAACALLGYTHDELLRLGVSDVLPPAARPDFDARWAAMRADGSHAGEVVLWRKDGTPVEVEQRATFDVLPGLHLSLLRDVAERRAAAAALRASEERLRLVHRATNDSIWDLDLLTGTTELNPAFTDTYGWHDSDARGSTVGGWEARVHPDDRARVLGSLQALIEGTGTAWQEENRFERADGTWADVLNRAYIVRGPSGEAVRIVGAVLDLSVQKDVERALIDAKEQAEAGERAKAALLANMSHEIRTPLTAVIGFAEILGAECQTEHKEYAAIIERAGRRLLDTLNSVLDLAQIEAGAMQLDTETVHVFEEAQAIVTALQPLAGKKGLALRLVGTPADARADRPALERILTNLVGNALKFTKVGAVDVEVGAEGGSAWLRVTDTGVGIGPEFLPHVFEEFKQESAGMSRAFEGSGLGLAITKGLVTMMGGELAVESEKGVGSTFTVRLPAA